tara:strand:- start:772 stop:1206 length:435 start_codon:yes stop_codon:yes gene_type:complete
MAWDIALMAAGAFITSQGIKSKERAQVDSARMMQRQNFQEMKRAQLGGLIDHNNRVEQFRQYENLLVLAGQGRQDRSIKSIRKAAATKSAEAMQQAQIRTLGQMSLSATRSEQAMMDERFARSSARNQQMMNIIGAGLKFSTVT